MIREKDWGKWHFVILAFAVFVLLQSNPATGNVLVVDGIEFAAHDTSGVLAKRKVFDRARKEAVLQALTILGIADARLADATVEAAIAYIEVTKEKIAPNYYKAQFLFGLHEDVLLGRYDRSTTQSSRHTGKEVPSWVYVVPIHFEGDSAVIWDQSDPWIRQWIYQPPAGRIPLLTTLPDDEDRELLKSTQAISRDSSALSALAGKYHAPAAAYVTLYTVGPGGYDTPKLEVDYWSPKLGVKRTVQYIEPAIYEGDEYEAGLVDVAASTIRSLIEQVTTPQKLNQQAIIPIVIDLERKNDWNGISDTLKSISGLQIENERFYAGTISADLRYQGNRNDLIKELRRRGFLN